MGTSAPSSPTHGKGLRPMYFISRGGGKLTPMIPADELPESVNLVNIKKVMTFKDTTGMTSIGEIPHSGTVYELDVKNSSFATGSISDSPGGAWRNKNLTIVSPEKVHANSAPNSAVDGSWRPTTRPEGVDLGNTNGMQVVTFNSGLNGDRHNQDKKLYCSYWLRHGECDYLQQGCKYLHVMPTDLETLNKCGLREIPRWYRNQQALVHQSNIARIGEPRVTAVTSLIESGLAGSAVSPMSPPVTPSKLNGHTADQQRLANLPGPQNYLTGSYTNGQTQFETNLAAFGPFGFSSAFPYATAALSPLEINSAPQSAIEPPMRYDQFAPYSQSSLSSMSQDIQTPSSAGSQRITIRNPNDLGFLNRLADLKVQDNSDMASNYARNKLGARSATSAFASAIARPQRADEEKDLVQN